uniref:Variant surface glycoprotein (VSG, atypical), putative n=1 Tax=Trypanosoma brucei brucei (strain 927/4 GUTat10.1) TaxID=185431 RepID=Q4FKM3_TRYB2|nr:variant surface glycoprotein (VSG, atypical), putative [Trypanosoma brucei brucei TREU927]
MTVQACNSALGTTIRSGMKSVATALLFLCVFRRASAADGTAVAAVSDECGEIAYLQHLKSHYSRAAGDAAQSVATLTHEAHILTLAAAKHHGTINGAKYAFLAAIAASSREAVQTKLSEATGTIPLTATELARRQGQLEALRHLNQATAATYGEPAVKAGTPSTIIGSADLGVTVKMQLNTNKADKCFREATEPADIKKIVSEIANDDNYKGVDDSSFRPPQAELQMESCGSAPASMNNCETGRGCADGAAMTSTNFLGLGTATKGQANTLAASTEPFKTGDQCTTPTKASSGDEAVINRKRTAHYLCNARQIQTQTTSSIKETTVGQLIASEKANRLALAALGQTSKEGDNEQGKNAVKKLLGTDDSKTLDKFFSALETVDLQLSQDKGARKTSIKAAAESNDYGLALAYFSGQALKRTEEAAKSVTKATQAKEDDCTGKKEGACTGECEWNNDKEICKLKKQGVGENKDKTGTTNTTGSNSVFINASLLLAVLFL